MNCYNNYNYYQNQMECIDTYAEQARAQVQMQQQLKILDDSCKYTNFIIAGILLTQQTLRIQKCQILNPQAQTANVYPLKLSSNLLILCALFFFFQLSETVLCNPDADCSQRSSSRINNIASTLVLIASMLRLIDLLGGGGQGANTGL
ncbi:hypothetical protein [[Clostridium] polysaccharolyticum]|uniref:Uncharacterized protein n=1 Tax=[Clostridium] polysaccharolyticum TaxID=29364 RepID=A0A1I0EH60_9FIRM|nr:hypothetical protein [[Clostridium] polysaccharolyticum]SET44579.1 hypothetical protein SAMN04487772_12125 [[Clostridium] polysaccharolyticum]